MFDSQPLSSSCSLKAFLPLC